MRLPERLTPLRPEDRIELGGSEARVIHTPGHSDFHLVLHDESRRLLFAGDHLLLGTTTIIVDNLFFIQMGLDGFAAMADDLRDLPLF